MRQNSEFLSVQPNLFLEQEILSYWFEAVRIERIEGSERSEVSEGSEVSEVSEEDVEAGPNAQEVAGVRKLRLRRPRPKIIAIDNEEGIAEGKPVPLKAGR